MKNSMQRGWIVWAAVVATIVWGGARLAAESAEEISRKAVPVESMPVYRAEFEMVSDAPAKGAAKQYGVKCAMREGDVRLLRTELVIRDASGKEDRSVTIATDTKVVRLFPAEKRAVEMPASGAKEILVGLTALLADSRSFTYAVREGILDGRDTYIVAMDMTPAAIEQQKAIVGKRWQKQFLIARQERWIDKESQVIVQMISYNPDGRIITGTKYTKIERSPALTKDLFAIPADYNIVRVKDYAGMIRQDVKATLASASRKATEAAGAATNAEREDRQIQVILVGAGILGTVVVAAWAIIRGRRGSAKA